MREIVTIPTASEEEDVILDLEPPGLDATIAANFKLFVAGINSANQLVYVDQTVASGPFSNTWTPIGTETYNATLTTGTTLDGRIAIVTTDMTSQEVIYIAEVLDQSATGADRWSPPENLGLPSGVKSISSVALARGVDGLDNVFVSSPENVQTSLWWKYRNPPDIVTKTIEVTPPGSQTPIKVTVQETQPPAKPWSDWININGALEGNLRDLKAINNADGRIVLTGIYFNAIPWVSQQTSDDPFNQESWSEWAVPGAPVTESAGSMTPILDDEGYVSVFISSNDGLLRSKQTEPGGAVWSTWSSPGIIDANIGDHAISIDGDGCLYAAVLDLPAKGMVTQAFGALQMNTEFAQWTSWQHIARINVAQSVDLNYNADGHLTMFAFDHDAAKLFTLDQVTQNSTEWRYFWTEIGDGLRTFSVARDLTP